MSRSARYDWRHVANQLKAMAHPVRLTILDELDKGAKCVFNVQEILDISQPNLSQHLTVLKKAGLVGSHSNGSLRCYYLLSPDLIKKILPVLKRQYPVNVRTKQSVVNELKRNHRRAANP